MEAARQWIRSLWSSVPMCHLLVSPPLMCPRHGHHDYLRPLTLDITELKYFRVFDRWGQLMFETNIIGKGWDGIFNGKQQVMDVYTWTLEAIGCDGHYYKRAGNSVL